VSTGPCPEGAYRASVARAETIDEPSNCATVRPLVRAEEDGSSMSMTWVSIDGRHRPLSSRRSARVYYILSGSLRFVLTGGQPGTLGPGDALVIPKGCKYFLEGTGTYLVLNTPAFEPGDDEYAAEGPGPSGESGCPLEPGPEGSPRL